MRSFFEHQIVKVIGTTLLVAGTSIGAGMLGLPAVTAASGFVPSTIAFIIFWALMCFTALLMLEVSLYHKEDTNLITMAKESLGPWGQALAWIAYIMFLYALLAAYTASGSALMFKGLSQFVAIDVMPAIQAGIFIIIFGIIVSLGTHFVDLVNRLIILGLVVAYFSLVSVITPHIEVAKLSISNPNYLVTALPIVATSFGFHLLIPSLKTYLNSNVKQLRFALVAGSFIPLLVYIMWEVVTLGVIPAFGENGLAGMLKAGEPVVPLTAQLDSIIGSSTITVAARFFTFFAIISSFIGASLGLFDFLADGIHLAKNRFGRIILALLTFTPPLLFVLVYPTGFIIALGYAGIFGSILLIFFPSAMAYCGRKKGLNKLYQVAGGNFWVVLAIIASLLLVIIEVLDRMQFFAVPS